MPDHSRARIIHGDGSETVWQTSDGLNLSPETLAAILELTMQGDIVDVVPILPSAEN